MPIRLKRAYDVVEPADGERYLVERLWPRGVTKERLALTAWLKDVAPSTELRTWYGHQPERREEFVRRYEAELASPDLQPVLEDLRHRGETGTITLVFSTKETELSGAVVLKDVLERASSSSA
jgi:uncharacterized protein YeaO (DUF488 family)